MMIFAYADLSPALHGETDRKTIAGGTARRGIPPARRSLPHRVPKGPSRSSTHGGRKALSLRAGRPLLFRLARGVRGRRLSLLFSRGGTGHQPHDESGERARLPSLSRCHAGERPSHAGGRDVLPCGIQRRKTVRADALFPRFFGRRRGGDALFPRRGVSETVGRRFRRSIAPCGDFGARAGAVLFPSAPALFLYRIARRRSDGKDSAGSPRVTDL